MTVARRLVVFWREGSAAQARALRAQGARVLAWEGADLRPLQDSGVDFARLADRLTLEEQDAVDEAAIAWTKAWGQRPIEAGRSFRDLLSWGGVSLWWFAELYLHHSTGAPGRVRLVETLHRVLEKEDPVEIEGVGLGREESVLLARTCIARGILFDGPRRPPRLRDVTRVARLSLQSRLNTAKMLATAVKNLFAPAPLIPGRSEEETVGARVVLFLSHAAFWKERAGTGDEAPEEYEHYFDRLIPGVAADPELRPFVLAVGPRAAFRRRRVLDRLRDWLRVPRESGPYVHANRFTGPPVVRRVLAATREIRRSWRRLRRSPGVREAFAHRGVNFADLSAADLAGTMLLQLPWAVRSREEMAAALEAVRPDALCLYAETSGWGRAALAAAREAGVPSVALQHGILYPKYFSYRRAAGEEESPRPDRTAVFGEEARRLLVTLGGYREDEIVITGSPKFDALLSAARLEDRETARARLGVAPGEKLVVVASRYRAIRETHRSIGSAFPALVAAVSGIPGLLCLVKPHPAEPSEAYSERIREAGAARVRLVPPGLELVGLLDAADALVTVESLSAVEALVLGRPVLVLNMPNNLRGLVDMGVALGVATGADPGPALHALLFDEATRTALADARQRYLSDVAHGVDGGATDRILKLVRETARAGRGRV